MSLENKMIWRSRRDAPTKEGWYYARPASATTEDSISPAFVLPSRARLHALCVSWHSVIYFDLLQFEWFGPVPECFELKI